LIAARASPRTPIKKLTVLSAVSPTEKAPEKEGNKITEIE